MSWRNFKNLFKNEQFNESQFILGIDVGNSTSAICYFDTNRKTSEVIDISGGYGKATIPTAVQYLYDTKELLFGEYAILNNLADNSLTLTNIIEKLEYENNIEIDGKLLTITNILGLFIKEIISTCKNINPKAEIVGIVVSTPDYLSEKSKQRLLEAFEEAGFINEIIDFVSYTECIFSYHYFNKKQVKENILLLDFGSRDIRGGIYSINGKGNNVEINTLSYLFDAKISTKKIEDMLVETFTKCYENSSGEIKVTSSHKSNLINFAYEHKDIIFQKNTSNKPIKLYFNFTFPPFEYSMTSQEVKNFIEPFKKQFINFLEELINSNIGIGKEPMGFSDIDTVLCTGGGFNMFWARSLIEDMFPDGNIIFYKNPKVIAAEGASILAAEKLGIIEEKIINIQGTNQVKQDIGIFILKDKKQQFFPLIHRNTFWWQQYPECMIIVNEKTNKPVNIDIIEKGLNGEFNIITSLKLDGILPCRPVGTLKIKLKLSFISYKELKVSLVDCGFGELYKASDYNVEYIVPV